MMLAIYGPTATGKTDLGIALAKRLNGEIISADSRQVYKGLDIATGKVSPASKVEKHNGYWIVDGVKINGFDLVEPGQNFTVANFIKFSSDSISKITRTKKLPIIVGGTGFYVKALIDGIDTIGISANPQLRKELEKLSSQELYQKLQDLDQEKAQKMNQSDRANPRRLIRAIEIAINKKYQVSSIKYQGNTRYKIPDTKYLLLGLTAPNDYLYKRADSWIDKRLESGMAEEVQNLLEQKISPKWLDDLGLECRWLSRYLLGKIKKDEAIKRLKGDMHHFIRRQKTWFKQFKDIKLFDIFVPNWKTKLENEVRLWYHINK